MSYFPSTSWGARAAEEGAADGEGGGVFEDEGEEGEDEALASGAVVAARSRQ